MLGKTWDDPSHIYSAVAVVHPKDVFLHCGKLMDSSSNRGTDIFSPISEESLRYNKNGEAGN